MRTSPSKSEVRSSTLEAIRALQPDTRHGQEDALRIACHQAIDKLPRNSTILLYVSAFAEEIETRTLILQSLANGLCVVLPRVDKPSRRLSLHQISSLEFELQASSLNIPEPDPNRTVIDPEQIDWALVPGIAFDLQGHRLGRGGGYYDRLLPLLRSNTPRWALALTVQIFDYIPIDSHDMRIDGFFSPEGLFLVSGQAPFQTRGLT